jgi:hypothetical protein
MLETLINLNETTRPYYSVDLDPQNFFADNSVELEVKTNKKDEVRIPYENNLGDDSNFCF